MDRHLTHGCIVGIRRPYALEMAASRSQERCTITTYAEAVIRSSRRASPPRSRTCLMFVIQIISTNFCQIFAQI